MFAEFVLEGLGSVVLHEKPEAFSITVARTTVLTFDRAGRPYAAFLEGRNYRRGLDNRVLEKWGAGRGGRKVRRRRWLTPEETQQFLARLHNLIQDIDQGLQALPRGTPLSVRGEGEAQRPSFPPGERESPEGLSPAEWRVRLALLLRYDQARLEEERERYRSLYRSVSILPPDQYRAVVVQATEGCHWNRCTFCDLYRDRPFRIRSRAEFRAHVQAVKSFLGAGLALRKSVFLGDANALIIAQSQLQGFFEVLGEEFPLLPAGLTGPERVAWRTEHPEGMEGIYSFIDAFSPQRKTPADFAELRERGLRRVYVGLETGHPPLLRWLNKPGHPADLAEWVVRLKEVAVQVGVILLVGAGGEQFAAGHVSDSIALVRQLPLDERDLIFLSELIDPPHGEYARRMAETNNTALSAEQLQVQQEALRSGLRPPSGRCGPKITTYDLREFVY